MYLDICSKDLKLYNILNKNLLISFTKFTQSLKTLANKVKYLISLCKKTIILSELSREILKFFSKH